MGYILLTLLIIELLIFYKFGKKNIVTPSFLGCAMFILSTMVYLSADEYFGYEIHGVTVAVIIGLLACVFVGERFADRIRIKAVASNIDNRDNSKAIEVPVAICLIFTVGILIVAILRFIATYQYSLTVGNTEGNILTMAKYVRGAVDNGYEPLNLPFYINQGIVISDCLTWFCIYSICNNKNCTGKFYFRYLWPIVCYIPNILITDNRTSLLRMLCICFIIIFIFSKQKNGWTQEGNLKIVFVGLLIIAAYLILFRLLGYRTETSLRSEVQNNFTEYMSASLVGLDKYLVDGESPNILFGEGTLKSVYNILRQWGLDIPQVEQFEPFYYYAQGESNIYTGLKAYIHDYTIVGAVAAMFLWGAIIGYNVHYIRKNGATYVRTCLCGMMFYLIAMLSIADVTSSFLAMNTVYTTIYLLIIDALFVKGRIVIRP